MAGRAAGGQRRAARRQEASVLAPPDGRSTPVSTRPRGLTVGVASGRATAGTGTARRSRLGLVRREREDDHRLRRRGLSLGAHRSLHLGLLLLERLTPVAEEVVGTRYTWQSAEIEFTFVDARDDGSVVIPFPDSEIVWTAKPFGDERCELRGVWVRMSFR